MTKYVILLNEGEDAWKFVGHYSASSAETAVRMYAERATGHDTLRLVAIPDRSWKPVTTVAETTRKVTIAATKAEPKPEKASAG